MSQHPKRPNNNTKALEGWESEGGAPASDDPSTKKKRPHDLNQWAKRMTDIVSGEVEDRPPTPEGERPGGRCNGE